MELTEILTQILEENPDKYSASTVRRVKAFVETEVNGVYENKPYRMLKTLDDFILYKSLHPEWDSWRPKKNDNNEANAFYVALLRWARNKYPDKDGKEKRKKAINQLFPSTLKWDYLKTFEDWKNEYDSHPEWKGKTKVEITKDNEGRKFYRAFQRWVNSATDSKAKARKLAERLVPRTNKDWLQYTRPSQWEKEYASHPEWHGLSSTEINTTNLGKSRPFYHAFLRWLVKEMPDKGQRREYVAALFERYQR